MPRIDFGGTDTLCIVDGCVLAALDWLATFYLEIQELLIDLDLVYDSFELGLLSRGD